MKLFPRIVAFLLVPCLVGDALIPAGAATFGKQEAALIADPATASGFRTDPPPQFYSKYLASFETQALSQAIVTARDMLRKQGRIGGLYDGIKNGLKQNLLRWGSPKLTPAIRESYRRLLEERDFLRRQILGTVSQIMARLDQEGIKDEKWGLLLDRSGRVHLAKSNQDKDPNVQANRLMAILEAHPSELSPLNHKTGKDFWLHVFTLESKIRVLEREYPELLAASSSLAPLHERSSDREKLTADHDQALPVSITEQTQRINANLPALGSVPPADPAAPPADPKKPPKIVFAFKEGDEEEPKSLEGGQEPNPRPQVIRDQEERIIPNPTAAAPSNRGLLAEYALSNTTENDNNNRLYETAIAYLRNIDPDFHPRSAVELGAGGNFRAAISLLQSGINHIDIYDRHPIHRTVPDYPQGELHNEDFLTTSYIRLADLFVLNQSLQWIPYYQPNAPKFPVATEDLRRRTLKRVDDFLNPEGWVLIKPGSWNSETRPEEGPAIVELLSSLDFRNIQVIRAKEARTEPPVDSHDEILAKGNTPVFILAEKPAAARSFSEDSAPTGTPGGDIQLISNKDRAGKHSRDRSSEVRPQHLQNLKNARGDKRILNQTTKTLLAARGTTSLGNESVFGMEYCDQHAETAKRLKKAGQKLNALDEALDAIDSYQLFIEALSKESPLGREFSQRARARQKEMYELIKRIEEEFPGVPNKVKEKFTLTLRDRRESAIGTLDGAVDGLGQTYIVLIGRVEGKDTVSVNSVSPLIRTVEQYHNTLQIWGWPFIQQIEGIRLRPISSDVLVPGTSYAVRYTRRLNPNIKALDGTKETPAVPQKPRSLGAAARDFDKDENESDPPTVAEPPSPPVTPQILAIQHSAGVPVANPLNALSIFNTAVPAFPEKAAPQKRENMERDRFRQFIQKARARNESIKMVSVCYMNKFRSPALEWVLLNGIRRHQISNVQVTSGGTAFWNMNGRLKSPEEIMKIQARPVEWVHEIAQKWGMENAQLHMPVPVGRIQMEEATVVIAASRAVRSQLETVFPQFRDKIFLFTDLAPRAFPGEVDVPDPGQLDISDDALFQGLKSGAEDGIFPLLKGSAAPGMSGSGGSGTSTGISASGDGLYSLPRGPEKPRMEDVVGPPRRLVFADSGELSRNETFPEELEAATKEQIRLSLLEENQRLIEKQVFATLKIVSRLTPKDIREALPSRRSLQYAVLMRELYSTFKYGTIFTSSGLDLLKQYIRNENVLINAILDRWRSLNAENLVLRAARLKPPEAKVVDKDFNVDDLWSKPEKGKDWKDSRQWLLQAREALFRKQLQNAAGLLQKVEEALLEGSKRPTLFMQRIREDFNAAQIMLKTLRRSDLFQAVPDADVVETDDVLSRVDAVLVKSLSKSIYNYGISLTDLVTSIHDPVRVGLDMGDRSGMGTAQLAVFVDTIYHAIGGKRKSLEPTVDSPKITPKKPKGKVKPTQPLQIGDPFPGKVISGKVIQIEPDRNYASTPALRIQLKTQHRNGIAMQGGLTIHRLISEFGWPRSLAEITFAFHFPEMQRRNQTKRSRRSA